MDSCLSIAMRNANRLEGESECLKEDALIAGAMPDDFRVVHRFVKEDGYLQLKTFLV